jgi:beta-glucosidase
MAVDTAAQADLVVLVLGENEQTSREAWNRSHMGDRASLELIGRQQELVEAIAATGKPVIALLFSGRPNAVGYLVDRVSALLECWYLGQEAGVAVAEILFGDQNPCGKLPMSFPRSSGHLPCYYNYKPSARRGYLGDDVTPLFPFGFGMSYTTFALSNLRLEQSTIRRDGSTRVHVDVANTGTRPGVEVVQLYVRDLFGSVTRPVKELKGFARVALEPGETKRVTVPILSSHLAFTTISGDLAVEPGEFEVMVGTSSRDEECIRCSLQVTD